MKTSLACSALLISLFATAAFAQEDEVTTEKTQMDVQMPGMPGMPGMNVKMKVKTQTTRTTTTTTSQPAQDDDRPPPPPAGDECGAGAPDPGCSMYRGGSRPMDREEYLGFLESLRGNDFELQRESLVKDTLKRSWLTARQLDLVLDLFDNELTRLAVAKNALGRVVNPKHALKLSTKFENSINASDYTKVVNAQR